MTCPRCQGFLDMAHCLDIHMGTWMDVRRCVNCGHIEDDVILKNRQGPKKGKSGKRRRKRGRWERD